MSDEQKVQQLLDEILDSELTPEEVCGPYPELLAEVQRRWRLLRRVEEDLGALFPEPARSPSIGPPESPHQDVNLPRIPGYEVEAVLGRGGMGVVFQAQHLKLKRIVALKMLLAGAYAGPRERERFQREAEAVAVLRHPNVVQIHDVGDSDGRSYFTMEYVEGGNLAQQLAGTPQPARQAAALVATLAKAVNAAHRSGIVHRDLKPANILLTADGTPKISDFGLARILGADACLTRTGAAVGTPSYMAPEQAAGKPLAVEPAVDIYALGTILYEALTGRPPFRAETAAETVQQVIAQDPLPPSRLNSKVSRDLETICLKALHKEPRFRYATADALADDLDRFLRGETIAARPEGPLGRLTRRVRRRPMFSVAVSVVTLFTVALVGSGLGLLSERAATERAAKAEQAAAERSAEEDLQDMAQWLKKSSWPEATAALERAKVRLGDRGSSDLHNRIDQGARELALVERLDAIRLGRAISAVSLAARKRADEEYQAVFLDAGIAKVFENPEIVAERIKVLNVQAALTDALDDWHDCALDGHRLNWLLTVAGLADPDPASWRTRARVKKTWRNEAALAEMMAAGLKSDQCGPLLLGLARHWRGIWKDPVPFLVKVEQAHPEDLFANLTLAELLVITDKPEEAVRYYQAALAARPSAAGVYNNFGQVLGRIGRLEEAVEQLRRAVRFAPTSSAFRLNLALALNATGQCDEALEQGRRALGIDPKSATIHCALGDIQEAKGQHGEALAEYSQAIALEPTLTAAQQGLRAVLMRQGREEEARTAWQRALESNPPEHGAWYGYAEYCLFLGQENEYRRARQVLFEKYGKGRDMVITERTCRAYLLGPASGENLRQAVASAESIAAAEPRRYQGFYPYFLFVQGLGQYRQGHFDQAIATMRGDTSRVLGPAPRLVLAMALHRSGRVEEARQTLAAAILGHDWRLNQVHDQDDWIYHVLRREAEGLILPNLSAFLEGKYQPKDNDERLILLGVCQFTNRSLALSRLYADIFASAPQLAQGVRAGHRYNAACYAALAGCGRGVDAIGLGNPERRQCRLQARQWLRADLNAWSKLLEDDPPKTREMLRKTLTQWRETPELGGLRDPVELGKLPADEQKDCLAIWAEVGVVLNRCGSVK